METGKPSRTAHLAAFTRARHQRAGVPRVLDDPLVALLAGDEDPAMTAVIDSMSVPVRNHLIARQRYTEDAIAARVGDGLRQVVVLGAGLDTIGYRTRHEGLRVFEVDHPDTQTWKRKRLADGGVDVPDTVRFAPVDLESENPAEALAAAGFADDLPTFFVWLGVIYYLSRESAVATIRFVAAHGGPAELAFDYAEPPPSEMNARGQYRYESLRRSTASMGDRWLTEFTPAEIAGILTEAGLDDIHDLDMAESLSRYGFDTDLSRSPLKAHILRATRSGDWRSR